MIVVKRLQLANLDLFSAKDFPPETKQYFPLTERLPRKCRQDNAVGIRAATVQQICIPQEQSACSREFAAPSSKNRGVTDEDILTSRLQGGCDVLKWALCGSSPKPVGYPDTISNRHRVSGTARAGGAFGSAVTPRRLRLRSSQGYIHFNPVNAASPKPRAIGPSPAFTIALQPALSGGLARRQPQRAGRGRRTAIADTERHKAKTRNLVGRVERQRNPPLFRG